ncbi:hypothetical protein [Clostridium manihotivorum]|uniref:hypothetical protein n=1 Tax=Clostridium manihotivorum TaxID=2320868 RepID=UPI001EE62FD2|nr:hypothetical protein [Clostridium manihotivorum]
MISDETKRKLRELNLDEMVDILKIQDDNQSLYLTMTFDERITLAIDGLYQGKNNKRSEAFNEAGQIQIY